MHPSPLTPESITEYILFNSECSVIICRQCKCALAPGVGIKRHFQNLHPAISLQIRKEIVAYSETHTLLPPADVITPGIVNGPVEGLELPCINPSIYQILCGGLGDFSP